MHTRPYEKIIAWKEAYSLCLLIYKFTNTFPSHERFALVSQMRRAASSVPINIAEGNVKRFPKEKVRYFDIAAGSLEELHCEVRLSKDLQYCTQAQYESIDQHTHRVSYLIMKLRDSLV